MTTPDMRETMERVARDDYYETRGKPMDIQAVAVEQTLAEIRRIIDETVQYIDELDRHTANVVWGHISDALDWFERTEVPIIMTTTKKAKKTEEESAPLTASDVIPGTPSLTPKQCLDAIKVLNRVIAGVESNSVLVACRDEIKRLEGYLQRARVLGFVEESESNGATR